MIPLASDLLPFPGQMRREDHLKSASLPDRLSSFGRFTILCSSSRKCPEALQAGYTTRAAAIGARFAVFRAIPKFFSLPKLNYTEKNRRPESACSDAQG